MNELSANVRRIFSEFCDFGVGLKKFPTSDHRYRRVKTGLNSDSGDNLEKRAGLMFETGERVSGVRIWKTSIIYCKLKIAKSYFKAEHRILALFTSAEIEYGLYCLSW